MFEPLSPCCREELECPEPYEDLYCTVCLKAFANLTVGWAVGPGDKSGKPFTPLLLEEWVAWANPLSQPLEKTLQASEDFEIIWAIMEDVVQFVRQSKTR